MSAQPARREAGIAIIAALWAVSLLAIIVISVMHMTRADARLVHGRDQVVQFQALADGAIAMAILSMLGPSATQPPVTGTPFVIRLADREIAMSVLDESGKVDLNMADAAILQHMLAAAGLGPGDAEEMANRILDWRSPAGERQARAGDAAAYAAAGLSYGPRNAPFQSVEELRLLLGMTDDLFAALRPLATVYSQTGGLDPAFADTRLLAAFAATDATARAALQQRQEVARGAAEPPPSPGVAYGTAYSITAQIADQATRTRVTRQAVVRLTGQAGDPLLVYRWD